MGKVYEFFRRFFGENRIRHVDGLGVVRFLSRTGVAKVSHASPFVPLISPWAWVAGVLDSKGRFVLDSNDRGQFTSRVVVACDEATGTELSKITGVGRWSKGRWVVPAAQQREFLDKIMYHLRVQNEAARKVFSYRVTADMHMKEVPMAVKEFRESLRELPGGNRGATKGAA